MAWPGERSDLLLARRCASLLARRSLVGLAVTVGACASPQVRNEVLGSPDARFKGEFASVATLREVSRNQTVVIDRVEQSVWFLDWDTQTRRSLGQTGSGPNEYRSPQFLYRWRGDSVLLVDTYGRRIAISASGELAEISARIPRIELGAGLRGADSSGRLYYVLERAWLGDSGGTARWADSITILRTLGANNAADTVARLADAPGSEPRRVNGITVVVREPRPLSTRDQWAVAPDGTVALVHHAPYQVEFIEASGRRTLGPVIEYQRLRVTDDLRREWEARARQFPFKVPPPRWPREVPPFLDGAVQFDDAGVLWIERARLPGQPMLYDLVGTDGKLLRRIEGPPNARVAGFGRNGHVYLASNDPDDLIRLERYRVETR
jgi:hypothetical protein